MVDIILVLSVIITVIFAVFNTVQTNKEINQAKKDIEAIANAINVYSNTLTAETVEKKVKENVDLFAEWISGEVDEV